MPFNGSGVYQRVRNWVADAAAGIKIRADYHDSEDDGFAAGLSNCITKDGQTVVTQNIPFNNKRITGLADPVNPQDAATKASVATLTGDKLPNTGGTLTGDMEIEKTAPALVLNSTDATASSIKGSKIDKLRWEMRLGNGAVESGANVGSDFDLLAYADDGTTLTATALKFDRASGLGLVKGDPTAALGIATKQYSDAASADKVLRAGDTLTGKLTSKLGTLSIGQTAASDTFEVRSSGQPSISFHIPSVFQCNFGMDATGNFWMGGGSFGAGIAHRFWSTKDFAANPASAVTNGRLVYAGDYQLPDNTVTEPYGGAVATGGNVGRFGDARLALVQLRFRYMQLLTTGWFTVGYA